MYYMHSKFSVKEAQVGGGAHIDGHLGLSAGRAGRACCWRVVCLSHALPFPPTCARRAQPNPPPSTPPHPPPPVPTRPSRASRASRILPRSQRMQSLVRIPETLVCAMEFITLATPNDHQAPMADLRLAVLRSNPDLKDKSTFWKRKASVLKVGASEVVVVGGGVIGGGRCSREEGGGGGVKRQGGHAGVGGGAWGVWGVCGRGLCCRPTCA